MALDPSGYQVSVIVKNPNDGTEFPLWMAQGGSDATASALAIADQSLSTAGLGNAAGGSSFLSAADLAATDLPIVESVELELSLGLIGKATIQIAAPYKLGLKLLSSSMFKIGNIYKIRIGYPRSGRYTPWFESIASKPTITIDPDSGLTGTLNGDATKAATGSTSSKVYTSMSYREIIEEIADSNGWTVVFQDSVGLGASVAAALGSIGVGSGLDEKRTSVSQENDGDWMFIQRMCRSVKYHAYVGYGEDNTQILYVQERKGRFDQKPRYGFVSRGNANFETTFPILGFESSFEGVFLPGRASKVVADDIDPRTKTSVSAEATAETSNESTLGAGDEGRVPDVTKSKRVDDVKVEFGRDGDDRAGERLFISSRDHVKLEEGVEAHRNEAAIRNGVTGSLSSFGIPDLLPSEVVDVKNLGVLDGLYFIDGVRHTVTDADWTMLLMLLNNGTAGGIWHDFFTKESPASNTEQVDDSGVGIGSGTGATDVVAEVLP